MFSRCWVTPSTNASWDLDVTMKVCLDLPVSGVRQIQRYRISGWVFALQTYSVLKVHSAYTTAIQKFQGGRWLYKLVVSLKFTAPPLQR